MGKCENASRILIFQVLNCTLSWYGYISRDFDMVKIFSEGSVKEHEGDNRERGDQTSLGTKHARNLTNLSKELKINYDGDALLRCYL